MKKNTLIFCIRGDAVLLAMKKRGFGAGKWNGFGGKTEAETDEECAVRELKAESSLEADITDLKHVASINFHFAGEHKVACTVYLLERWQGTPEESEEMRPRWFSIDALPFDQMWAADRIWVPLVLSGKKLRADVFFNASGDIVEDIRINEVTSFS